MPNWLYLSFHFLDTLGLAIWIGGMVVLGALTAPALFRTLPVADAGAIFGSILRRFALLRLAAMVLVVAGAGIKYLKWETHAATPWIAARWVAIAFMAVSVTYEILVLEPALVRGDEAFQRLHRRAERLMQASFLAALVALFFS